jgi:hypothetical protein
VERSRVVPRSAMTGRINLQHLLIVACDEVQVINAVSIRHQRPFRAVTASDDASIVFFTGVPYKNDKVTRKYLLRAKPRRSLKKGLFWLRSSEPTPDSCKTFATRPRAITLSRSDPMARCSCTTERTGALQPRSLLVREAWSVQL